MQYVLVPSVGGCVVVGHVAHYLIRTISTCRTFPMNGSSGSVAVFYSNDDKERGSDSGLVGRTNDPSLDAISQF